MPKNIKIYVSHRIDRDGVVINNSLCVPMRCGAVYDKRTAVPIAFDDMGENIFEKRLSYNELALTLCIENVLKKSMNMIDIIYKI